MACVPVHVWEWCLRCKKYTVTNCPRCVQTHERLHHQRRGAGIQKAAPA